MSSAKTGPAASGTAVASFGTARAILTGDKASDEFGIGPALTHATITIWVAGRQVYRAPLAVPPGAALPKTGAIDPEGLEGFTSNRPLCVASFGGSSPELGVLIGLYTGGAHCCTWVDTYAVRPGGAVAAPIEQDLWDAGGTLQDSAVGTLLSTRDNSFYYQFDAYAASGAPLRILALRGSRLVNLTKDFPKLVAQDAKAWWSAYQMAQSPTYEGPGGGLGLLAPWVADECVLGDGLAAWSKVDQLNREGRLSGGLEHSGGVWPTGTKYVKALRTFLTGHGYC